MAGGRLGLADALRLCPGDVVSFVGGGGKTSLGLRLVGELAAAGLRAVFTVTTRTYPLDLPTVLTGDDPEVAFSRVRAALAAGPVCVARAPAPAGKLAGLSPDDVGLLVRVADVIVVEADGSAGRPLKFPLSHEPVIPACTTVVVPVAGAEVVGKPFTPEWVHRAEAAAAFLAARTASGVAPALGTPVSPATVATLLWHPDAATRGRPPGARVVPVVNQADSPERLAAARAVAQALLRAGAPAVLVASTRVDPPVLERWPQGG